MNAELVLAIVEIALGVGLAAVAAFVLSLRKRLDSHDEAFAELAEILAELTLDISAAAGQPHSHEVPEIITMADQVVVPMKEN